MKNSFVRSYGLCMILIIGSNSISQTKNSNIIGGTLAKKYPLHIEIRSNKFEDSIKSFLRSEFLSRKFRIIDRTELDKLMNDEVLRRMKTKTPKDDAKKILETGPTVAQWLIVEATFQENEFSNMLDSLKWVIYDVPVSSKNIPQKATVKDGKEYKEKLLVMIDSAEKKK